MTGAIHSPESGGAQQVHETDVVEPTDAVVAEQPQHAFEVRAQHYDVPSRRRRRARIIGVLASLLAGGLVWWAFDSGAEKQAKDKRELDAAIERTTDEQLSAFNEFVTQLDDEALPLIVTVARKPSAQESFRDDNTAEPVPGVIGVEFGVCEQQYYVVDNRHDDLGLRTGVSDFRYDPHFVDDPLAIWKGNEVVGSLPPTELNLIQTFPAECAQTTAQQIARGLVPTGS